MPTPFVEQLCSTFSMSEVELFDFLLNVNPNNKFIFTILDSQKFVVLSLLNTSYFIPINSAYHRLDILDFMRDHHNMNLQLAEFYNIRTNMMLNFDNVLEPSDLVLLVRFDNDDIYSEDSDVSDDSWTTNSSCPNFITLDDSIHSINRYNIWCENQDFNNSTESFCLNSLFAQYTVQLPTYDLVSLLEDEVLLEIPGTSLYLLDGDNVFQSDNEADFTLFNSFEGIIAYINKMSVIADALTENNKEYLNKMGQLISVDLKSRFENCRKQVIKFLIDIILTLIRLVRSQDAFQVGLELSGIIFRYVDAEKMISQTSNYIRKCLAKFLLCFNEFKVLFSPKQENPNLWEFDDVTVEYQNDDEEEKPSFFAFLRTMFLNFKSFKSGKIVEKFKKFLAALISVNLLNLSEIKFCSSIHENIMISEDVKNLSSFDIFEYIADFITYICSKGYQAYQLNSVQSFFHSNANYSKILLKVKLAKHQYKYISNPELHGFTVQSFCELVATTLRQALDLRKIAIDLTKIEKVTLDDAILTLMSLEKDVVVDAVTRLMRVKPFCVLVFGASSQGKTSFVSYLIKALFSVLNIKYESRYIGYLNAADKFQDSISTLTKVIVADDLASSKPDKIQGVDPSTEHNIHFGNNMPRSLIRSAVEHKNKECVNAVSFICTTNVQDLNTYYYYSNPEAYMRRFDENIELVLKEQNQDIDGRLDDSTFESTEGQMDDIWIVKTFKWKTVDKKNGRVVAEYGQEFDSIDDYISHFAKRFDTHYKKQLKLVAKLNESNELSLCTDCRYVSAKCKCNNICQNDEDLNAMIEEQLQKYIIESQTLDIVTRKNIIGKTMTKIYNYLTYKKLQAFAWYHNNSDITPAEIIEEIKKQPLVNQIKHYENVANKAFGKVHKKYLDNDFNSIYVMLGSFLIIYFAGLSLAQIYNYMRVKKDDENKVEETEKSTKQCELLTVLPTAPVSLEDDVVPILDEDQEETIWNKPVNMTTSHVTPAILSMKGSKAKFIDIVSRATVRFKITYEQDTEHKSSRCGAINICDKLFVTARHTFDPVMDGREFYIEITYGDTLEGKCRQRINMIMTINDVAFENDLAILYILTAPVGKDLTKFIPNDNVFGTLKGTYISRREIINNNERTDTYRLTYLNMIETKFMTNFVHLFPECYVSHGPDITIFGDSGCPLIIETQAYGTCIAGVHSVLNGGVHMISTPLNRKIYNKLLRELQQKMKIVIYQKDAGDVLLTDGIVVPQTKDLPNDLSCINYNNNANVKYVASFVGNRSKPKSSVTETHFTKYLIDREYVNEWGQPYMGGMPYTLAYADKIKPNMDFRYRELRECSDHLFDQVSKVLTEDDLYWLSQPLSLYQAINGINGVKYINSMDFSTSTGFPLRKCKREILIGEDGDWNLNSVYMQLYDYYLNQYKNKRRCNPIFNDSLKDEAKEIEKILKKKTRVFSAAPFVWCLIVRRYLLPFIKVVQTHRLSFECMVGMDATSYDWHLMFEHLTYFEEFDFNEFKTMENDDIENLLTSIFAGDFGKYDKRMGAIVIWAAFYFITKVLSYAKASDEHILIVWMIYEDVAFSYSNFNGDLMQWLCGNPSGWPLTVIINSIVNSIYGRYFYMQANPKHNLIDFSNHVRLITLGDDNNIAINTKLCNFFDHTIYQKIAAEHGIEYTMADKASESRPFLKLGEIDFLKRGYKYCPERNAMVGRISEKSIIRSLMMCTASKTVSQYERDIDTLGTQLREYSLYTREYYDAKCEEFQCMLRELKMNPLPHTFRTYDYYLEAYDKKKMKILERQQSMGSPINLTHLNKNNC